MADADVTDKEKESAKQNEKEQDTKSGTPSSAKKRPASSTRTDSAKSKAKSTPKGSRAGSPKGKGAKGKSKPKPKEEAKPETPQPEQDDSGPPEGVIPLFLASKTQELFSCVCDEDVTADMPFKLIPKDDIIQDLRARAAVCDFSVVKQIVLDYPGEDLLIIYDADFKYGQNFLFATTEEAKERMLNPPEEPGADGAESGKEEEDDTVYKYVPPVPKVWVSLGSEKEIEDENVVDHRKKISMSVHKTRREFGAPVTFTDRNVTQAKDGYMECTSYEDKTYDVNKIEVEMGTQAVPFAVDTGSQTDWKHPRNANTQYYPREFNEEEKEEHLKSEDLNNFLNESVPRFKLALQQNEIIDVFYDDWYNLSDHDGTFGGKADNHLKEYQSFTDLQFSKEKTVTCINWHPTIRGVVAVSISEKVSFDDRIDHSAKIIMSPSLVLIWSFIDPIHPQLLLEAPDDIQSFQFCPTNPNIIAGGCMNGQVVLWDISQHADKLKQARTVKNKGAMNTLENFDNETKLDSPVVRYAAVSSIDHSHKAAITDIQWIPDHLEVSRMGVPMENSQRQCVQIMSGAADHSVLIWDTRPPKAGFLPDSKLKSPMGVPTTFRYLELTWKPMLRVTLQKSEPGGDHAPTKFSIQEVQGKRDVLGTGTSEKDERNTTKGEFQFNKPSSAKDKKSLQGVNTHFFVGTEDGEIVYVDWMPQKDQDTGKIQTMKPDFYSVIHDGPVEALQRSPFFRDIVLAVGGWTFTVWKEGVQSGPILMSSASNKRLTSGAWSPSRPGVFFISRIDGSIDVWDLLDRTHEPSLNQSISSASITSVVPFQVTAKQHLLGVGDSLGTLHVLEIPWSLRMPTPNEHQLMTNYFEREVKRRAYVVARWDFREQEKREIEAEIKRKAGIAPNVVLTDEEIEYRQKMEYNAFLEEEGIFLRELGLKDDDEPLPET